MSHISKVDGNPDFRQDDLDGIVERGLKSRHIQLIALGQLGKTQKKYSILTFNRWHNWHWTVHWIWWCAG